MAATLQVTASMYDSLYATDDSKGVLKHIDNESSGNGELSSLDSNGFLVPGDLTRFRSILAECFSSKHPQDGDHLLLDLGCGVGGLGRWLAMKLNCHLIGVDFSTVAINKARAALSGGSELSQYRYEVAKFSTTGLENGSVTAAISLDALYLTPDPKTVLAEVHRVLIPNGILLFTVYVKQSRQNYPGTSDLKLDWRPFLESTEFITERYEDVSSPWRRQMRIKHQHRWDNRERIRAELGKQAEAELAVSAAMLGLEGRPSFLDFVGRFEIIARR